MKTQLVKINTASAGLVRVSAGTIERRMFAMRGHAVMLDSDLAKLYRVTTTSFNQAVKRNSDRFPSDFMFQLTTEEVQIFKITICDLRRDPAMQREAGTRPLQQVCFTCFHRTRHRDAFLSLAKQTRGANEYSNCPRVHSAA